MKFLIALSILASSVAFAQDMNDRYLKCYEPAQQGEEAEIAYVMKAKDDHLYLVKPFHAKLALMQSGCLETVRYTTEIEMDGRRLQLCMGQGQQINGYLPVEASEGQEERTVYCDKKIKKWFYRSDIF